MLMVISEQMVKAGKQTQKAEDYDLIPLNPKWRERPLPSGCRHCLQGSLCLPESSAHLPTRLCKPKNLNSEHSHLHPVCLIFQAMTLGVVTCPDHLVVWKSSSCSFVNSLPEAPQSPCNFEDSPSSSQKSQMNILPYTSSQTLLHDESGVHCYNRKSQQVFLTNQTLLLVTYFSVRKIVLEDEIRALEEINASVINKTYQVKSELQ